MMATDPTTSQPAGSGASGPGGTTPAGPYVEPRRTVVIRRTIITVIVFACIAGLAFAVSRTEEDQDAIGTSGPGSVLELVFPKDGSNVLAQAQIGIDLTTRYDVAELKVNGIVIPESQLDRRSELSLVTFNPGPGKVIETLPAGSNCVQADVRRIDGTDERYPPIQWCFRVA